MSNGWAFPDSKCTAHYFVAGTSLCRLWRYAGDVSPTPAPQGIHCKTCAERAKR